MFGMDKGYESMEQSRGRDICEETIMLFQKSRDESQARKLVVMRAIIIIINLTKFAAQSVQFSSIQLLSRVRLFATP